jgi:hypothetical protein
LPEGRAERRLMKASQRRWFLSRVVKDGLEVTGWKVRSNQMLQQRVWRLWYMQANMVRLEYQAEEEVVSGQEEQKRLVGAGLTDSFKFY